ncbi:MAG: helix-turn-helix domain-containing protein [Eubacteriales bacterium]|nr:helix-turn-helix domain-containing protein [Eubacteriales bacterium]
MRVRLLCGAVLQFVEGSNRFPFLACISPLFEHSLLKSGVDNKTLDTLKKGGNITLLTVEKLCTILDCTPNEIVRFIE